MKNEKNHLMYVLYVQATMSRRVGADELKPRLHLPGKAMHLVKSEEGVAVFVLYDIFVWVLCVRVCWCVWYDVCVCACDMMFVCVCGMKLMYVSNSLSLSLSLSQSEFIFITRLQLFLLLITV